jgi:hypothetical protein
MTRCATFAKFTVSNVSAGSAPQWAWISVQFISKTGSVQAQNVGDSDPLSPGTHEIVTLRQSVVGHCEASW